MCEVGYYLETFLAPLAEWLERPDVTDIWINRPGEVWVETLGGSIERHERDGIDEKALARLARQIAAFGAQGISREHPLLGATLPDGSRVQIVAPPATRGSHALAIRRHVSADLTLDQWGAGGAFDQLADDSVDLDGERAFLPVSAKEAQQTLAEAVRERRNILIAGGTSTGKTTFLNALLKEIPREERLILIEDTEELNSANPNTLGLLAARGALAEAQISAEDLLIAALRMRPDRIILGEIRGSEAFTFLRAINTGHPGSIATIHANSPARAVEQLTMLVLQSGSRLDGGEVRRYVRESVDVFVQLERREGKRRVSQLLVST
ncbi:P-type DNA transfer ATPase VirB11 [Blastomonas marina]|uniref:P-type DNA transfer ATPase VirB11 n=1 Tax=Blastomonas marina TaxID=1867408 RepID=UPI002AC9CAD7|nr:P-type DNA transfer ATPase VirB11 [Blastomonas marina]WPZ03958.1 P-type DNA transfer ATPase VirB11 [Blastomonas marina]